jgi:feruloyl esterase
MRTRRSWIGGAAAMVAAATVAIVQLRAAAGAPLPAPAARSGAAAATCASLAALALPNAAITLAEAVAAGAFASSAQQDAVAFRALPAFCRVAATLTPTADSDIHIEVWMPSSGWNGRLQAVGNGAFSGAIAYRAMAAAVARGYAAASTDTGHSGGSARFALGHPEKVIDFGWRAVHEMAVAAKTIIAGHYDAAPTRSYWNGCSAGGRQAMKEAQRFPADFDGIIAGAPGLDWTGRAARAVHVAQALEANSSGRLAPADMLRVHQAVLDACDVRDGVKDGLLEDPDQCTFDPAALQCSGANSATCLSSAQVATVRLMYSSPVNPRTGRAITGLAPGSELGWTDLGWTASARATGLEQFRFIVFKDPAWIIERFNFDTDIVRAEETDNDTINALNPDLRPFIARGGKLIHYHGWSDPQISPRNSTQYYSRVVEAIGGRDRLDGSYRLFMAPGMAHCGGGEGPNSFDMIAALEQWVQEGRAPDRIVATHSTTGVSDRTRPLCPYPQHAFYKGTGSTDDAVNFECRAR